MQQATRARVLKTLRTIHAWLGIVVLPWVLIVGLTGFYLNHSKMILGWIQPPSYDESTFADWPDPVAGTRDRALELAIQYFGDVPVQYVKDKKYHSRPSIIVKVLTGEQLILSRPTGHYFVKHGFWRDTYAPDGTLLHRKFYFGSLFKRLHTRGWTDSRFGTWIMDITSFALVTFALTGIFLWWMPRARKFGRMLRRKA